MDTRRASAIFTAHLTGLAKGEKLQHVGIICCEISIFSTQVARHAFALNTRLLHRKRDDKEMPEDDQFTSVIQLKPT